MTEFNAPCQVLLKLPNNVTTQICIWKCKFGCRQQLHVRKGTAFWQLGCGFSSVVKWILCSS